MHGLKATRLNSPFSFLGTFGEDKFISIIFFILLFSFSITIVRKKKLNHLPHSVFPENMWGREFNLNLIFLF